MAEPVKAGLSRAPDQNTQVDRCGCIIIALVTAVIFVVLGVVFMVLGNIKHNYNFRVLGKICIFYVVAAIILIVLNLRRQCSAFDDKPPLEQHKVDQQKVPALEVKIHEAMPPSPPDTLSDAGEDQEDLGDLEPVLPPQGVGGGDEMIPLQVVRLPDLGVEQAREQMSGKSGPDIARLIGEAQEPAPFLDALTKEQVQAVVDAGKSSVIASKMSIERMYQPEDKFSVLWKDGQAFARWIADEKREAQTFLIKFFYIKLDVDQRNQAVIETKRLLGVNDWGNKDTLYTKRVKTAYPHSKYRPTLYKEAFTR